MFKIFITDVSSIDEDKYNELYERAPELRKEKADAYKHGSDKVLSICAWALLEHALNVCGFEEKAVIELTSSGKPYLKGENSPFFSLSHSGTKVMCAVSDSEVGCDVEKDREVNDRIAKRFFAPNEQGGDFLKLWTEKESYSKLTGKGADEITPELDNGWIHKNYNVDSWYEDGYTYAYCAVSKEKPEIDYSDVL